MGNLDVRYSCVQSSDTAFYIMAMLLYICSPIIKRSSSSPIIAFPSLFYLENEKCTIFSHYMNRWTPLLLAWFRKIRKHLRPSVAAARELNILWLTCRKNWRLISRKEHTVVCLQNPLTAMSYLLGIIWEVWRKEGIHANASIGYICDIEKRFVKREAF